jgi:aarF domain-containing kinase
MAFQSPFSSSSSNSNNLGRDSTRNRKTKTSLRDRSPQEAMSLMQDIVQAVLQAGPMAGPARTMQAYQAITQTLRDTLLSSPGKSPSPPFILRTLFERMGATYIKLGQFIASSPTIFPKEYVLEFQKCLDQTEPVAWNILKPIVEDELGAPLSRIFAHVDPKPLASASIAQVHTARLLETGEDVVIKIQKPGIESSLQADLNFLYIAARLLEFVQPDWERTSLSAVMGDIRQSMLEELDFTLEAKHTIEFRRFLQDQQYMKQATAPRVYLKHTTRKVMVLERLNGVSLLDETTVQRMTRDVDSNIGTNTILTALNIWSLSITQMPWFHADVHAGNLLLLQDGRVGFIDFGIVGRISPQVLQAVQELSIALSIGDSQGMARALCRMGATDAQVDTVQFGRDIDQLMRRMSVIQPDLTILTMENGTVQGKIDVNEAEVTSLLLELVEITENNGLKLPREFGLLVKQCLYFDRYLKILAPSVDVFTDSRVTMGGASRTTATTTTVATTTATSATTGPITTTVVAPQGGASSTTQVVVVDVDSKEVNGLQ